MQPTYLDELRKMEPNHSKTFAEMPNWYRMEIRDIVDDNGGMISHYDGPAISVALPSNVISAGAITAGLAKRGMMPGDTVTYFPIGGDNPPESMRHFGPGTATAPRGDQPSYWLYRRYTVEQEA